jgi:hypothetical protein|tara:strand:+ start:3704 stop:3847 length:144 start_codon:yes stop_codon:yes gene_type:complete
MDIFSGRVPEQPGATATDYGYGSKQRGENRGAIPERLNINVLKIEAG